MKRDLPHEEAIHPAKGKVTKFDPITLQVRNQRLCAHARFWTVSVERRIKYGRAQQEGHKKKYLQNTHTHSM